MSVPPGHNADAVAPKEHGAKPLVSAVHPVEAKAALPTDLTPHPADQAAVADLCPFNTAVFDKAALGDISAAIVSMRSGNGESMLQKLDLHGDSPQSTDKASCFVRDAQIINYTGPGGIRDAARATTLAQAAPSSGLIALNCPGPVLNCKTPAIDYLQAEGDWSLRGSL